MRLADNRSEYTARTYIQGDETSFVLLFNTEHANLAGFVPRTVEYWRWCCLERPDVTEKSILIVEKENKTVGYVVVGKSGNIWELCYDSSQNAKAIVSKLLTWAEDYARSVGSSSMVLNAYNKDLVVREVCQDMDFAESLPEPTFLTVLDLPQLIREVLQAKSQALNTNELFWFNLKNCPPWCLSRFGVRLEKNQVTILEEHGPVSGITIEAEMSAVVGLIFRKENLLKAVAASKVQVHPFWKIFRVKQLFELLEMRTPWFMPRADIG
jgi:hypothetical protein